MILLDTNVISELMRPAIAPAVVAYLGVQDPESLFLARLSEAEIRHGIARLPACFRPPLQPTPHAGRPSDP